MTITQMNKNERLTLHWQYGRQDDQPLGGRSSIWQWFGRKEIYSAAYFYMKHFIFNGHW